MSEGLTPFKRRRVDGAVQKPFKSPMRTPLGPTTNTPLNRNLALVSQSPLQKSVLVDGESNENVATSANIVRPHRTTSSAQTIGKPGRVTTPRSSQNGHQKRSRELESTLRVVRRENDQLKQAISILKSAKDRELEALIEKWCSAARLAAEAVYGTARDKVNRMGGVEGLREQERHTKELRKQWEQEDKEFQVQKKIKELRTMVDDGEATEDDLQRFIVQTKEKPDAEYLEDDFPEQESKKDVANDEDGYTMGMMLRDMRIDFHTIGYCSRRKCWE